MSKYWCFTINNEKYKNSSIPTTVYDYCIMGNEIGDNGTPHIQGFIVMKTRKRLSSMKNIPGLARAHLEIMRGSPKQASAYCKKDGDYFEDGDIDDIDYTGGSSGGKMKAEKYKKVIKAAKDGDFDKIEDEEPSLFFNHYRTIRIIRQDYMNKPKDLDKPCGIWIYGEPGVGKSYTVRTHFQNIYDKPANKWWDGYQNEDVVLIDDLDLVHNMLGHHLKRWADCYSFPGEMKGTTKQIRPKLIIVTSNYTIEDMFQDRILQDALKRRFKVYQFTELRLSKSVFKSDWADWAIEDISEDLGELDD